MGAQRRHSTKFIASGSQEAKETRYIAKKYFRLQEAADLFSIGISKTIQMVPKVRLTWRAD